MTHENVREVLEFRTASDSLICRPRHRILRALRDSPHITGYSIGPVSFQRQVTTANNRRLNMRKFILIAALVLLSATAQAGGTRGLTLASNDEPAATDQPNAVEAPKYVERPAAVDTTTQAPKVDQAKPVAERNMETPKPAKAKCKSTEARVIYELHRHGIYW
jgi:hypothetical protein